MTTTTAPASGRARVIARDEEDRVLISTLIGELKVSRQALFAWRTTGIAGCVLRTEGIGRRRFTRRSWLAEWGQQVAAARARSPLQSKSAA